MVLIECIHTEGKQTSTHNKNKFPDTTQEKAGSKTSLQIQQIGPKAHEETHKNVA